MIKTKQLDRHSIFLYPLSPLDDHMNASEIRKIRKTLKWSLRRMAKETGIHHNTLYRWENHKFKPSGLGLFRLEQWKQTHLKKELKRSKNE